MKNVIACVPNDLWSKEYGERPLWKHIYHMLHSLDLWMINPNDQGFCEPSFHVDGLNNLDVSSESSLSKEQIDVYLNRIQCRIDVFLENLNQEDLIDKPSGCDYTRLTLILAQHRHLHSHMGMIMGFIIAETGFWPSVLGLENDIPEDNVFGIFY